MPSITARRRATRRERRLAGVVRPPSGPAGATMAREGAAGKAKSRVPAGSELEKPRRRARKPRTAQQSNRTPGAMDPGSALPHSTEVASTAASRSGLSAAPAPLRVIEPPTPGLRRYCTEIWHQRSAFGYFMRQYVQKRIGRTFLGYLWIF